MIELQILSKVLTTKDYSFLEDNFDETYFVQFKDEYQFIVDHYKKYGQVPDEATMLAKFQDFNVLEVAESDSYLLDTMAEQKSYNDFVPVLQKSIELSKTDSRDAISFLQNEIKNIESKIGITGFSIIKNARERLASTKEMLEAEDGNFIPTGFAEIDKDIKGLRRGNEFVVLYARTNHGKSWVLEKICEHSATEGYVVGYFDPEMSVKDLGYRFDTLHDHISNSALSMGMFTQNFSIEDYEKYIENLDIAGDIIVTKPKDFQRRATVSKLRSWIKKDKLDLLAIDGITYLVDERYKKGDSKTISLTNISEDLMDLSEEMQIPIIVVVQANRGGVVNKDSLDTPELENIRDSDGIAQNASIVYAVRQVPVANDNPVLIIENKKMRIGRAGMVYKYSWNIDEGTFTYQENVSIEGRTYRKERESKPTKRKKKSEEDAF